MRTRYGGKWNQGYGQEHLLCQAIAVCDRSCNLRTGPGMVFPSPQAACDNVDAFCPGNRDS